MASSETGLKPEPSGRSFFACMRASSCLSPLRRIRRDIFDSVGGRTLPRRPHVDNRKKDTVGQHAPWPATARGLRFLAPSVLQAPKTVLAARAAAGSESSDLAADHGRAPTRRLPHRPGGSPAARRRRPPRRATPPEAGPAK